MATKVTPSQVAESEARPVVYRPHPDHEAELQRSIEEADRGEYVEVTEELLRWMETGEGPCPIDGLED